MNKYILFTALLSVSTAYAGSHVLQPGQVALVQQKDGNWAEIKSGVPTDAQKPAGIMDRALKFVSDHPMITGSALAVLGYAVYHLTGVDPDALINARWAKLQSLPEMSVLRNLQVPNHSLR